MLSPKVKILALSIGVFTLAACSQHQVAYETPDGRPKVAFTLNENIQEPSEYRVYVNGLYMGSLAQFRAGMPIVSGDHVVTVVNKGTTVLESHISLEKGKIKKLMVN